MAFPLELRERLLAKEVVICCGLPPGRPMLGMGMAEDFPDKLFDLLEELALPLFFRSNVSIGTFPLEPHPLLAESAGVGLPLRERLSKAALIFGGIGTW